MNNNLAILFFITILFWGCQSALDSQSQDKECDPNNNPVNFIFKYGVGETKNTLNTYSCSFTKDMVCDPAITIPMKLSFAELDSIYNQMLLIDFFNLPDTLIIDISDTLLVTSTPFSTFYFYVESNFEKKELFWQDDISGPNPAILDLLQLISMITDIVRSKDSYLSLPQPRCGYD